MKTRCVLLFLLLSMTTYSQEKLNIFFDFNKDIPNANSTDIFNKWMNDNPSVTIVKVSGFCDSIDSNNYNKDLALRRINSILKSLKGNRIRIYAKVIIDNNGKDFKQAKNQGENRKVTLFYNESQKQVGYKIKQEVKLSDAVKTSKIGELIKLKNLYFYNNLDKIVPKSEPTLKELLKIMNENPKLKIEIQGHICCKKPNQPDEVSEARAKMVCQYLIQNKIDRKRLAYKGYGVSRPIHPIPEKNVIEEDENRRVEILIVEK